MSKDEIIDRLKDIRRAIFMSVFFGKDKYLKALDEAIQILKDDK